ncbi:MAG: PorT family protein [Bacteroidales bacterium]|nr:PorT family protein [Bacteroidales bacterium]
MKKIVIVLIIISWSPGIFCQEKLDRMLIGYNSSWYRNTTDHDNNSLHLPGLFLGYQIDLFKINLLDIETGIGISTKGSRLSSVGDTYIRNIFVYIELPLLLKAELSKGEKLRPFIFLGPSLNANIVCFNWSGFIDDIRNIDLTIISGCGLRMDKISLSGRYSLGVTNFDISTNDTNLKNSTFSIVFGFEL